MEWLPALYKDLCQARLHIVERDVKLKNTLNEMAEVRAVNEKLEKRIHELENDKVETKQLEEDAAYTISQVEELQNKLAEKDAKIEQLL